jgi:hypothetical protein
MTGRESDTAGVGKVVQVFGWRAFRAGARRASRRRRRSALMLHDRRDHGLSERSWIVREIMDCPRDHGLSGK